VPLTECNKHEYVVFVVPAIITYSINCYQQLAIMVGHWMA